MERVSGTRGGANIPPERREIQLSKELEASVDHIEHVAKRAELQPPHPTPSAFSDGSAPGSEKVAKAVKAHFHSEN